jgi:RNA polymerase sigma-70 factor (ECF subfamily)
MSPQTDTALFDEVYAAHRQALHAYFFGRTSDMEVAQDLLQETFLRAWRNLPTLRQMQPDQHRYWLFAIGKNLLIDHYRRQSTHTREEALGEGLKLVSMAPAPDVQAEHREQLHKLDVAIRNLPKRMRTVLAMQVLGEMNSDEIGQALNMPAGTVRYQLSLARKRLMKDLFQMSDSSEESDILTGIAK